MSDYHQFIDENEYDQRNIEGERAAVEAEQLAELEAENEALKAEAEAQSADLATSLLEVAENAYRAIMDPNLVFRSVTTYPFENVQAAALLSIAHSLREISGMLIRLPTKGKVAK